DDRADVVKVVNDALTSFSRPFEVDGRELFITASLGASLFPDNATTATDLIKQADSAMYLAKEAGRCTARFYDGTIHARVLERLTLEQDLRQALAREEFHVELQPIVDLPTRRINAAEVLLRWTHPVLGSVPPDRFIPIAEELGIIVEISRWVLRNACRIVSTIRGSGYPDFRLSVNLSARDLYESDLLAFVGETLVEYGLSSDAIDVEVTEHVLLNDTAVRNLANLRALGIRVLIDDFGTGYSSLEYLKRLPVGAIKIDKTFISDVTRNTYDQAIVKAITTLGQALHVPVIAEGLESESQIEFVESLGCDQAQGYAFSRPIRLEAFMDLLPGRAMQKSRVIPLVRSNAS
ncbi:MAG: EAL domain-containing protein, partial [Candidatus Eremiobacteraeota bacterium]|nr:EAL domain-containing protein [Candidatus Eremiobacteraeota bacterium]